MFVGFTKDENGKIKTMESNKYQLYDNLTDFFADAEPCLRATVILPDDEFKGESVDIWCGIYIGKTSGSISPLIAEGTLSKYESSECKDLIVRSSSNNQTACQLSNGEKMNPTGLSGRVYGDGD